MFRSIPEKGLLLPFGESVLLKTKALIFGCRCCVFLFPVKGSSLGKIVCCKHAY